MLTLLTPLLFNSRFISVPFQEAYVNLWPLCFITYVPVLVSAMRATCGWKSAVWGGLSCGLSGAWYAGRTISWAWWHVLGGGGVGCLFGGILAGVMREFSNRSLSYREVIVFGILYTLAIQVIAEYIGTLVLTPVGLAQFPLLMQPLRISGYLGIEFMVGITNLAIALLIEGNSKGPGVGRLMGTVWTVWMGVALFLFYTQQDTGVEITVAAVSTGGRQLHGQEERGRFYEFNKQAKDKGAEIVVWPEQYINESTEEGCRQVVRELFAEEQKDSMPRNIVIGCAGGSVNLAYLVSEGQIAGVYGKNHAVWEIGEVSELSYGYPIFHIPTSSGVVKTLIAICYDLDFPRTFNVAAEAADIVLIPSFDLQDSLRNHYWAAQFRAVESGVAIVKADMGWDSALIDNQGRRVQSIELKQPDVKGHLLIDKLVTGKRLVVFWQVFLLAALLALLCWLIGNLLARQTRLYSLARSTLQTRSRSPVITRQSLTRGFELD